MDRQCNDAQQRVYRLRFLGKKFPETTPEKFQSSYGPKKGKHSENPKQGHRESFTLRAELWPPSALVREGLTGNNMKFDFPLHDRFRGNSFSKRDRSVFTRCSKLNRGKFTGFRKGITPSQGRSDSRHDQ